jgi:hypothetical protein
MLTPCKESSAALAAPVAERVDLNDSNKRMLPKSLANPSERRHFLCVRLVTRGKIFSSGR